MNTLVMSVRDACCEMKSYLYRHVDIVKCVVLSDDNDKKNIVVRSPVLCEDGADVW
jgi:hypothetical protein